MAGRHRDSFRWRARWLVTWGIATLAILWLLTSAVGSIIGGGFSALGSVMSASGSGISEAARKFDDAQAKLQQARDTAAQSAKDAVDATASAVSKASFGAFFVLLLSGLAAALGGAMAVQRRHVVVPGNAKTGHI
jgi:hypothetical protein